MSEANSDDSALRGNMGGTISESLRQEVGSALSSLVSKRTDWLIFLGYCYLNLLICLQDSLGGLWGERANHSLIHFNLFLSRKRILRLDKAWCAFRRHNSGVQLH